MSTAEFLCSKAANSRVVLASCKDALLQALGDEQKNEFKRIPLIEFESDIKFSYYYRYVNVP